MPDYDHSYPLAFDASTGDFRAVQIGSAVEVGQCAQRICDTPQGAEYARPDFGVPELAFAQGAPGMQAAADGLLQVVESQEPRAAGQFEVSWEGPAGGVGKLTVDVRSVADYTTDEEGA